MNIFTLFGLAYCPQKKNGEPKVISFRFAIHIYRA